MFMFITPQEHARLREVMYTEAFVLLVVGMLFGNYPAGCSGSYNEVRGVVVGPADGLSEASNSTRRAYGSRVISLGGTHPSLRRPDPSGDSR